MRCDLSNVYSSILSTFSRNTCVICRIYSILLTVNSAKTKSWGKKWNKYLSTWFSKHTFQISYKHRKQFLINANICCIYVGVYFTAIICWFKSLCIPQECWTVIVWKYFSYNNLYCIWEHIIQLTIFKHQISWYIIWSHWITPQRVQ